MQKYDIEKVIGIPWKKKKSYRYLYTMACNKGVILKAFKRMKKGKTDRKDIQMVENDLDNWVEKMQQIIINTKPAGWKVENPELAFDPPDHNPVIIKECGKTRVIYVPTMVELWIHHVIVLIIEPIVYGSSYHHSYSSFPGRGSHRGKKTMRRWIAKGKGIRNFAQCDIRHFYDHARYSIIRKRLVKRIKDALFMHLIDVCLKWFPNKLPLGFYISQWLANFLLQEIDYLIKCKLKIAHHIRYMDNFTLADDNKKKLHMAIIFIKQWLGKVRLRMKGDWQVFRFEYTKKNGKKTGRPVSAMGWLFYRNKVIIRKRILIHIARMARKLNKKKLEKKSYPAKLCNYNKAVSCGMDKGAYFFGCAFSVADAVKEAQYFIGLLNGKRFEYPVFYDVEGKMLNQDRGLLTDIVIAFCEELENNGYYVGIYTSESHYNSSLDDSRLAPYTHWTAKYSKNSPSLSSGNATAMWQYGGEKNFIRSNQIAGTTCDQDYCYVDYPSAIINGGMNGYGTEPAAPEQPQPTPEQPAPTTAHSVGEVVSYGTIYASSDSDKGLKPAYNSGEITKIVPGARNPYLIGNGTGWINDGCISESAGTPVPEPASIGVSLY